MSGSASDRDFAFIDTAAHEGALSVGGKTAAVLGKEAALFVPTGTMGNTIAIKLLTQHGQEVICDVRGHRLDLKPFAAQPCCHSLVPSKANVKAKAAKKA